MPTSAKEFVSMKKYIRDMANLKRYVEGLRRRNISLTKSLQQRGYNERNYLAHVKPLRLRRKKIGLDKKAGDLA